MLTRAKSLATAISTNVRIAASGSLGHLVTVSSTLVGYGNGLVTNSTLTGLGAVNGTSSIVVGSVVRNIVSNCGNGNLYSGDLFITDEAVYYSVVNTGLSTSRSCAFLGVLRHSHVLTCRGDNLGSYDYCMTFRTFNTFSSAVNKTGSLAAGDHSLSVRSRIALGGITYRTGLGSGTSCFNPSVCCRNSLLSNGYSVTSGTLLTLGKTVGGTSSSNTLKNDVVQVS